MSNNLYDILGKLQSLEPKKQETKAVLTESAQPANTDVVEQLNEKYQGWKKTVAAGKKLGEASKPDYIDLDKDGDKKETMKKAAKDAKQKTDEGHYDSAPKKVDIPAYQRKAKGGDWKVTQQDLEADKEKNLSSREGLAKLKRDLGMNETQLDEYETDSKGRYVHKGTYGGADSDDGSDDDYDEWGNKKAGAKKPADGAPKKRGRPAKNKGPERTTAKAWKHKGSRVSEAINIETFVEDAMAEIEGIFVTEKAVSKAQQKFMGMVHAAQKGEKPASKEVAKVAKSMGKKDAKDFASTKHKGLPQHVKESRETLVENSLQAIVRKFGKEVRDFAQGGELDNDLFDALYDYYFDDMPYGVKKARDGDPYEWIAQRFDDAINHGDVEVTESNLDVTTEAAMELDELARLAGLGEVSRGEYIKQQDARAERSGHDEFKAFGQLFKTDQVEEAACNHTAEGVDCPVHGMVECGSMMEGAKPDYIDLDKDGDKEEPMKKAAKDKEEKVDECMSPMGSAPAQDQTGMNINASIDTKTGNKTITVSAEGEAAEQLAQMLKMAGLVSGGGAVQAEPVHVHTADEVQEEFANEPEEAYADTQAIVDQGDDLNRRKVQDPATANRAANPLKVDEDTIKLEGRLAAMYNSLKIKTK